MSSRPAEATLGRGAIDHHAELRFDMPVPAEGEPVYDRLPARRGVVLIEDEAHRPLLLAATADARAFARRRLTPPKDDQPSRRVPWHRVAGRLRAATCGSPLEADHLCLVLCRDLLASTYRALTERWRGWFVHVDPTAEHPRFTKLCTTAFADRPAGLLLGPIADKHAAARYREGLEDLFDLCRYHHILVQAPDGTACAYKDMGRCPAPCDGSESLAAYRRRVEAACDFAAAPEPHLADWTQRMERAAGAQRFEDAAAWKRRLDVAAKLRRRPFRFADGDWRAGWIAVAAGERPGWLRLLHAGPAGLRGLVDLAEDARPPERAALPVPSPPEIGEEDADVLGLVCVHLARVREVDAVRFVRPDRWDEAGAAACRAVRHRLRKSPAADATDGSTIMDLSDTDPNAAGADDR